MNNAIIYLHNIQNEYYHILKSKEQIVFSDDLNLVESYLFPWDEGNVTVLAIKEATLKLIALYILYQLQKITLDN